MEYQDKILADRSRPNYLPEFEGEKTITYGVYQVETSGIGEKADSSLPPDFMTHKKIEYTWKAERFCDTENLIWVNVGMRNI
jgi:hypothetical protein